MPLSVSPSTLPNGTPGTPYSQALTPSGGTAPYKMRLVSGSLPPGMAMTGGTGNLNGCTIDYRPGGTYTNIKNGISRWAGLVYPISFMKVYATSGTFPIPSTLSAAPTPVRAAVALGVPFYMCFKPASTGTYNDTSWPGGADKPTPSQVSSDQTAMINSVTALQSVGAVIAGIVINQEGNSTKNALTADQYTYMYYRNYAALKAAFPSIPVISIFAAYQLGNANIAAYFPGPTALSPGAALYTDGIGADWYHEGYNHGCFMYSGTPATVPGYADLADYANVSWGITEAGNSGSGNAPDQAQMTAYLSADSAIGGDPVNSCQAVYQYRRNNNKPCLPFMWYENDGGTGPNIITSTSDFRIPLLREMVANNAAFPSPVLSGTPAAIGTYPFVAEVRDSAAAVATFSLSITIGATLTILTSSFPPGTTGAAYHAQAAATGGTPYI